LDWGSNPDEPLYGIQNVLKAQEERMVVDPSTVEIVTVPELM
jgi:hypothetical protein